MEDDNLLQGEEPNQDCAKSKTTDIMVLGLTF
jgi:hypothetical protein